jgi:hypothetical protein
MKTCFPDIKLAMERLEEIEKSLMKEPPFDKGGAEHSEAEGFCSPL